jgi:DNA-binding PadR family transcriptional regulator
MSLFERVLSEAKSKKAELWPAITAALKKRADGASSALQRRLGSKSVAYEINQAGVSVSHQTLLKALERMANDGLIEKHGFGRKVMWAYLSPQEQKERAAAKKARADAATLADTLVEKLKAAGIKAKHKYHGQMFINAADMEMLMKKAGLV